MTLQTKMLELALRYHKLQFDYTNEDTFDESAEAYVTLKNFIEYIREENVNPSNISAEVVTKYIESHRPTSLYWYRVLAPFLVGFIMFYYEERRLERKRNT